MDRIIAAANAIKSINQSKYDNNKIPGAIQSVCSYFDMIKSEPINESHLKFLRYIANAVGIPHYYTMLDKFQQKITNKLDDFDLKTFSSLIAESYLHTSDKIMIHRYQKQILSKFTKNSSNRFFLSASTSFGKTFVVYEIIKKMDYKNIVLIFPTIALLSENLERIYNNPEYQWIKNNYKVRTLTDTENITEERNLFIYTPERYLSFIDSHSSLSFDFAFIDEVYKMDNDYLIDDENRENERDIAYRLALFYALLKPTTDALLAGPFIEFPVQRNDVYNPSFDEFLRKNKFQLINYNTYEIVNKSTLEIKTAKKYNVDNMYSFEFNSTTKQNCFKQITQTIIRNKENLITYCATRSQAESYAKLLIDDNLFETIDYSYFNDFLLHLETVFTKSKDWVVVKGLKKGIGIHHGLVPKYIQKEIINLFNDGYLNVLLSTTTITEGVNTSAKNVLVLSEKKGDKLLKKFDAQNIAGRAGRFLHHYNGRVIVLQNKFVEIKNGHEDFIKHKNYDLNSPKEDIDLYHTHDEYLKKEEKEKKEAINSLQEQLHIPDNIMNNYKVISKKDKIQLYEHISKLSAREKQNIQSLIQNYHLKQNIQYDGFEDIIRIVLPIVKNEDLRWLMTYRKPDKNICILTSLVYSYLRNGFKGSVDYYATTEKMHIDCVIRRTSKFVYNTLKYQVVKYLGAFNLMYKYRKSKENNIPFEKTIGIDALLLKLEYNSSSLKGRIASDYGVPQKVVEYFDKADSGKQSILDSFDNYENNEFKKVCKLIEDKL